jgi:hypothetical protein
MHSFVDSWKKDRRRTILEIARPIEFFPIAPAKSAREKFAGQ